jgi:hypothetical protein
MDDKQDLPIGVAKDAEAAPAPSKAVAQGNGDLKEKSGNASEPNRQPAYKKLSRTELGKAKWDEFAANSPQAWLWHRYDYADIWSAWPDRKDVSFALFDAARSQIVATVPVVKRSDRIGRFFAWNSLDAFGGIALNPLLPKKVRMIVLESACEELQSMAREHEAHQIRLSLSVMTPEIRGADCPRVNPLLELGCANAVEQAWVCDLRKSKEELWQNIGKGAKSSIKKAEKNGVQVRMAGEQDLDVYYRLHCETYRRTGTPVFPREFFEGIWKQFLPAGLAAIFVAEHQGQVIAAANMAVYKKGAYYWTGASNETGLSLGANALLQWAAMQWMVNEKIEWYEVGAAFPYARDGKLKQLSDFKKDFGGALYPQFFGTFDTKNRTMRALGLVKDFQRQILG